MSPPLPFFWSKSAYAVQFTVHYTLSHVTNILSSILLRVLSKKILFSVSPLLKWIFTIKADRLWMMLCFLEFFPVEVKSNLFGTDPDRNRVTWETPSSEAIPFRRKPLMLARLLRDPAQTQIWSEQVWLNTTFISQDSRSWDKLAVETVWAWRNLQLLTSSWTGWRALVQILVDVLPLWHVDPKWDHSPAYSAFMGGVSRTVPAGCTGPTCQNIRRCPNYWRPCIFSTNPVKTQKFYLGS